MISPDVNKEKNFLKALEKLQKKQDEVNQRLTSKYNARDDKLNAVLSGTINNMQQKLVTTLDNNNRAVLKDFVKGSRKNIDYVFEDQAEDVIKILELQNDTIDKLKKNWENQWSNLTKNFINHFSSNVTDVFDTVKNELKGHFDTIFGPIMDNLVTPLLNIGKSFGKALGLFGTEDKNADITAQTLLWIKNFYKEERKRDLRSGDDSEQQFPWLNYLGIAMITLGGIIGGLARKFTLFFEIFQIQKLGLVQRVINFFAKIGQTVGNWIDDAIRSVSKIPLVGKFVSEVMEQFMKFFPAVAKGFKLLGWPLTIFLSAIDFIRGFMSEEGNILDKIQGGVKKAIDGFIDLPVWILGKAGDWLLSKVGMEIEGGLGEKIRSYILGMSDIFMMPLKMLSNLFTGFVDGWKSEEGGILDKLWSGLATAVIDVFTGIIDNFKNIFTDNIMSMIPGAGAVSKGWSGIKSFFSGDKIEHGTKDYSEKGGPISSTPSGRIGNVQDSSFISLLSQIRNILNTKLNQIIKILTRDNMTSKVVSGMSSAVKSIGSGIGNFLSGKDDKTKPDVKEVVGVGTQLTEVPGSTSKDWEDPMGNDKRITSEFGGRIHPVTGKMQGHKGLDMAGPEPGMYGYPIKASKDGIVSIARSLRGYGNVVYVNHDDGYQTRYAHLQDFKVKAGDMVNAGQVIGGMGNTGVGTGPHLHYEVRKNNKALNPKDILSAREGAYIGNQSSEMGIPANVHPNEAILPLNDNVLGILGEKIAKFVSKNIIELNPVKNKSIDIIDKNPANDFVKVSQDQIRAQDQISKDFITSIKQAIDGLKDYRMDTNKDINNIMMNNNINSSNEPPDQIENGLLLIMNSGWGVT